MRRKNKGITLIALVVTIVVLLILAGVSISMLTGESGIIRQAQEAKEQNGIGKEKEYIKLAFSAVKAGKIARGDMSDVTSAELQEEINNYTNGATVTGTGILKITYASGREYEIDASGKITNNGSYSGMYSVEGLEGKIAPQDLFEYEIIDEETKTARIVRIKAEYCNYDGYNPHTAAYDLEDTNLNIIYNEQTISDMLVIPYEMEQNGEKYTITEANMMAEKLDWYGSGKALYGEYPSVDNIVYPNSIVAINTPFDPNLPRMTRVFDAKGLKTIVLSDNLKEIPEKAFYNGINLTSITIPNSVTSIESYAFHGCSSLTSITIPDSVTSIRHGAFYGCSSLTSITIPESVTSIESYAFYGCSSLTNITIPDSVTSITMPESVKDVEMKVFEGTPWYENQPDGDVYIGKVYYKYKGEMIAGTSIIIKEGTTEIAPYAFKRGLFSGYSELADITIPDSVKFIGKNAFDRSTNLTSINIKKEENSISGAPWGAPSATINWNYTGE